MTRIVDEFGLKPLLTPGEVAALFRVDPKTVTRWANAGKLPYVRTRGGHRRFLLKGIGALLEDETWSQMTMSELKKPQGKNQAPAQRPRVTR